VQRERGIDPLGAEELVGLVHDTRLSARSTAG
jgi:hypothetical protein